MCYFCRRKNTPAENEELVGVCVFTGCVLSHLPDEILEVEKPLQKRCYPSSALKLSLSKPFRTFSHFLSEIDVGPEITLAEDLKKKSRRNTNSVIMQQECLLPHLLYQKKTCNFKRFPFKYVRPKA